MLNRIKEITIVSTAISVVMAMLVFLFHMVLLPLDLDTHHNLMVALCAGGCGLVIGMFIVLDRIDWECATDF